MGLCTEIDVLHFRRADGGAIEAVRTTQVVAEDDAEDCRARPEKQHVVATIVVP
jgi:hypothetical protein